MTLLKIDVIEIVMMMTIFLYEGLKVLADIIVSSDPLAIMEVTVSVTSSLRDMSARTMVMGLGVEATAELLEGANALSAGEEILKSKAGGCLPHKHLITWRWMGVHMNSTTIFGMVGLYHARRLSS